MPPTAPPKAQGGPVGEVRRFLILKSVDVRVFMLLLCSGRKAPLCPRLANPLKFILATLCVFLRV